MINEALLSDNKFWKTIEFVEALEHPILVSDLFSRISIDDEDLVYVLEFLEDFNFIIETDDSGKKVLHPPQNKTKIVYDFSVTQMYMVRKIEESFAKGQFVILDFFDLRQVHFHVHQLLFLEDDLCLIGEDSSTGRLIYYPISEIQDVKIDCVGQYTAQYSELEVNAFLNAIRAVNENKVRLVLKIASDAEDINPRYHYLGRPFLTNNWNGEKIWAATVEESDYLYQWLLSINERVEIMDPSSVKRGLLEYCKKQLEEDDGSLKNIA
ncbi:MAG: WYL domain-containing protein [Bacteriovoracaceae bacterium]|nr:WYL domain-containing protein [Bacteriovoracaceae bacterium]